MDQKGESLKDCTDLTPFKEQAEQANLAKSRFLAAASHDLRQPLHAMGLFLDTLRDRLDSAGAADKKLLENITVHDLIIEADKFTFSSNTAATNSISWAVKPAEPKWPP